MPLHEFNLLESVPKIARDVTARKANKEENRRLANKFDIEYFDGTREQGYGGYRYDGRWVKVAKRAMEHFNLKPGDRVLDIGCAKGFFVKDLREALPGLDVEGLDISDYALENSHPDAAPYLIKGACEALPYPDDSFAAAFAINTIHNLEREGCIRAIKEIERVAPGRGFIQVDAYRSPDELSVFEDWMLTAKTFCMPDEWLEMFKVTGYTGAYYWTILEVETTF